MDKFDQKKLLKSEARNNLDSKYYGLKDKLENDAKLLKVIRDSEKTALKQLLEKLGEWIDDIDEETVTYDELKVQVDSIEKIDKPIFARLFEFENRPIAAGALTASIENAQSWIAQQRKDFPEEDSRGATNDDLQRLEKLATESSTWLAAQKIEIDPKEDAKVTVSEITGKKTIIEVLLNRLKIKKPPKKTTTSTTTTTTTSTATTTSSTSASEKSPEPEAKEEEEEKVEL